MTFDDLMEHYGNQANAARKLKLDRAVLCNWKKRGKIPRDAQYRIQVLSDGQLLATEEVQHG